MSESVLRKRFVASFTQVPNSIINDKTVSLKAKGLYLYMVSKPDDWEFSFNGMESQLKEKEAALRSAINELISTGYLLKTASRNSSGLFVTSEYEIFDVPQKQVDSIQTGKSSPDNPAPIIQPGKLGTSNTKRNNTKKEKEEVESPALSFSDFVDKIRSCYVGQVFHVDDVSYHIARDGYMKVSATSAKVAAGRAKKIYQRMYARADDMLDYFDRQKAFLSQGAS